jgi:hypothetical protein
MHRPFMHCSSVGEGPFWGCCKREAQTHQFNESEESEETCKVIAGRIGDNVIRRRMLILPKITETRERRYEFSLGYIRLA